MQAIRVVYLGPTNFRGSRYKATAQAGSVTIDANQALSGEENATQACQALRRKLGWTFAVAEGYGHDWAWGNLPDGSYAFINPNLDL